MSIKAKLLLRFLNQAELAKVLCRRDCQEGPDGGRYDRSAAGVGLTSIGGEGPQGPGAFQATQTPSIVGNSPLEGTQ